MASKNSSPAAGYQLPDTSLLEAICDTLFPSLTAEEGDPPELFETSASDLGVAAAMIEAFESLRPTQRSQLRLLFRMLEQPVLMRTILRAPGRFSRLDVEERERALLALANSGVPQLRSGFQGLKRLAGFLFYTLPDASGTNPPSRSFGYTPPLDSPASPPLLRLSPVLSSTTIDCDSCVIGSGAGGGVVAATLAAAGRHVVVLEGGEGAQSPDFTMRELDGMRSLYLDSGMTGTGDLGIAILAGGALGGGTAVNWQTSLPLPEDVRREWSRRSGCSHFVEASFARSLDRVMERLGVSTTESVVNENNEALRRGCERLGYRWQPTPRNARGCDPAACGSCVFGCRHGGKQSTTITYLHDAQQLGETTIIPRCRAERLQIRNGHVTEIHAIGRDDDGGRHDVTVRAREVIVAAGAIGSPVLLLKSGIDLGALGRNLLLHPTSAVAGRYDHSIAPWSGAPQSIMCDEFADLGDGYGFRLETAPAHPGLMGLGLPWLGARDHRRTMAACRYNSAVIVLARDRDGGRVRVDRDGWPTIEYRPGAMEREHLRRGIAEAARVHLAAGAHEVLALHASEHRLRDASSLPRSQVERFIDRLMHSEIDRNRSMLFSAHQMGTCRMGTSPRDAVCDENGRVFGVDNLYIADASAFPASSGVNPMITIMALADHVARRMVGKEE